jgi:peptide/nickel transport system substrate-binding protein
VPDLAARQPRITDDGRTYTIDLRAGVRWDVPAGRQVTAPDVVRGIKRLCNPADPSPELPYFTGTIVGLAHFCAGFATIAKTPSAMAAYAESTPLPGVHADNDMTVSFHLIAPARDFLNLLTLPAASPVPTEMLAYAPDSAAYRSHLVSDGPYRITSYTPGKQILMRRNTQWSPGADPARTAYVDGVQVDFGVPPDQQAIRLANGTADLALDAADEGSKTASSVVVDRGTVASLFFNLSATTAGAARGAVRQRPVRQSLQRCVDGPAVVRALNGPELASASHQVLVPSTWGYQPQDIYQAGQPGGTQVCRMGLALSGVPHLSLTYVAIGRGRDPAVVAAITEGFARAGITLQVVDGGSDERVLTDARTHWDIALLLTTPDWPGDNARSYVVPRLTSLSPDNVGHYLSAAVLQGLASAAAAPDDTVQARRWAALDTTIMREPPYVPLARLRERLPRSVHIGGWSYLSMLDNADPTQIYLPVPESTGSPSPTPTPQP